MENIINNPGLQHITEKILFNLNYNDLRLCEHINQTMQQILNDSFFWLRKLIQRGLSPKNQEDWKNAIVLTKNSELEKFVLSYLKKSSKNTKVVDLYCYIDENFIMKFGERIKVCREYDNSISECKYGMTLIHWAAYGGNIEIVKVLAPLTDNPDDHNGRTPIAWASDRGHTEIVKILAPLMDNPNAPDKDGKTPILWASYWGRTEIVKILAPLTDNPNAPDKDGKTPSSFVKNAEIKRFLESFKADEPSTK